MHCPFCNYDDTKVVDSRLTADNLQVRRRRECLRCNSRFSTYETIELNLPRVVKKDNARLSGPPDTATIKSSFKYPTERYLNVIKRGYKDCGLNNSFLFKALNNDK